MEKKRHLRDSWLQRENERKIEIFNVSFQYRINKKLFRFDRIVNRKIISETQLDVSDKMKETKQCNVSF